MIRSKYLRIVKKRNRHNVRMLLRAYKRGDYKAASKFASMVVENGCGANKVSVPAEYLPFSDRCLTVEELKNDMD